MVIEGIVGLVAGLIGQGITAYQNHKMEVLKAEEKAKDRSFQIELLKMKASSEQLDAQVLMENAAEKSFQVSQEVGNQKVLPSIWVDKLMKVTGYWRFLTFPVASMLLTLMGIADVLNVILRPVATIYVMGLATYIYHRADTMLSSVDYALQSAQIASLVNFYQDASSALITLAVTILTWWFGVRGNTVLKKRTQV